MDKTKTVVLRVIHQLLIGEVAQLLKKGPLVVTGTFSRNSMKRPLHDFLAESGSSIETMVIKITGTLSEDNANLRIKKRLKEGSNSPIVEYTTYLQTHGLQTPWPEDKGYFYREVEVGAPPKKNNGRCSRTYQIDIKTTPPVWRGSIFKTKDIVTPLKN